MNVASRPDLDLNLPDGQGVDFPPPVVPPAVYCAWLEEIYQDLVRRGALARVLEDPTRRLADVPFRLIE